MKQNTKLKFVTWSGLFLAIGLVLIPLVGFAAESGNVINQFICTPEKTTLYGCINNLYRTAVVIAIFLGVLFTVVGGYQYMVGGEKGKEKAKSQLSSTIVALLILSTSYILLRQINPDLVKFKDIQIDGVKNVSLSPPDRDIDSGGGGGGGNESGSGNPHPENACGAQPNDKCPRFDKAGKLKCVKSPCHGQAALVGVLNTVQDNVKSKNIQITISATTPRQSGHQSDCHGTGACTDIIISPATSENLAFVCSMFTPTIGIILNEYYELSNGTPAENTCGNATKSDGWTADHLHIGIQ